MGRVSLDSKKEQCGMQTMRMNEKEEAEKEVEEDQ